MDFVDGHLDRHEHLVYSRLHALQSHAFQSHRQIVRLGLTAADLYRTVCRRYSFLDGRFFVFLLVHFLHQWLPWRSVWGTFWESRMLSSASCSSLFSLRRAVMASLSFCFLEHCLPVAYSPQFDRSLGSVRLGRATATVPALWHWGSCSCCELYSPSKVTFPSTPFFLGIMAILSCCWLQRQII